ncbi:branched-chain amino acid ABC transporter permease [Labrenzia sp. 011]|uniref:branched-chain amino acid ABC transporter permease n=1 Tax=Labrenzia sp. 011 TaxID=2171494 RepID=UPI000D50C08A|nr:branched-chain amino acid ABC transporter permease [Labrenzia sp. 011]PVB62412.1 branched-chain amino acid ABC transporter permease [Labrenzia sp. 011]
MPTRFSLVLFALAGLSVVANDFFLVQIGAQAAILGLIALSLTVLAGWGGIVSLSQMTVAGIAGYSVALLGSNSAGLGFDLSMVIVVPSALAIGTVFGVLVGALAGRTSGIHTIMITLAVGVAVYFLANQNYTIFNGFTGYAGLEAPKIFGLDLRQPVPFFLLCGGLAAAGWALVSVIGRSPFGIGLIGVRDNARRLTALGYNVPAHRLMAHGLAAFLASVGGILLVWYNGRISPGTISVGPMIDILIIAVIGGMARPIGPFIGALLFVLLKTFAIDLVDPERFNTVIGLVFVIVVLVSRDGLLGLADRIRIPGLQRGADGETERP